MLRAESESELNRKLLLSWGHVALLVSVYDNTHGVLPTRMLTELWYPKFSLGLHFIGVIDWLPLRLISVTRSTHTMWPKAHTLNHMVAFLGVASPHSKHRYSHQVWQRLPSRSQGQSLALSLGKATFFTIHFHFKIKIKGIIFGVSHLKVLPAFVSLIAYASLSPLFYTWD